MGKEATPVDGCKIPLTQGQFALVDQEDFERIAQFKWYARWDKGTQSFRALRNSVDANGKRITVLMHREVLIAPNGSHVDHRRHDSLDNRKSELRLCTVAQNNRNRRLRSDNHHGVKGATWMAKNKKWRVRIWVEGKVKNLGLYRTLEEAAAAYRSAAVEVHGEYAYVPGGVSVCA